MDYATLLRAGDEASLSLHKARSGMRSWPKAPSAEMAKMKASRPKPD